MQLNVVKTISVRVVVNKRHLSYISYVIYEQTTQNQNLQYQFSNYLRNYPHSYIDNVSIEKIVKKFVYEFTSCDRFIVLLGIITWVKNWKSVVCALFVSKPLQCTLAVKLSR